MRGPEAQAFVESDGAGPRLVRSQLNEAATPLPRPPDRIVDQLAAQATTTKGLINPHALDKTAPASPIGDVRDEGELHDANHLLTFAGDGQLVVRVGINRLERREVALRQWSSRVLALPAQLIVGQQFDDPG